MQQPASLSASSQPLSTVSQRRLSVLALAVLLGGSLLFLGIFSSLLSGYFASGTHLDLHLDAYSAARRHLHPRTQYTGSVGTLIAPSTVGPGRCRSPRHKAWPILLATSSNLADIARHVMGCSLTQDTSVQNACRRRGGQYLRVPRQMLLASDRMSCD